MAGLAATLGNGAMSNGIHEIEDADAILIFGYNGGDAHPIVERRIIKAKEKGAKIIVVDPRKTESAKIADEWLQIKNGTNMALVNAFANYLIEENLYDKDYVEKYTDGFDDYKKIVSEYTIEHAEEITGIDGESIKNAMKLYAGAKNAMILYGMGVCHYSQAVDVVKGLSGLALITGNFGRKSVGIGPVRGQNNVQGACDMGALPNLYPGYQDVRDEKVNKKFEKAWNTKLSKNIGAKLTEVPKLVEEGKLKAYYIMGEDPVQSEPDSEETRRTLDNMELVIVQDIFMNKTALHADVILPATSWGEHEGTFTCADRGIQLFRKAIEPIGEARSDFEIICAISTAMGYPMNYKNTNEIWDEIRTLCPDFAGITYEKLNEENGIQWPCTTLESKGTSYLYKDNIFSTPNKRGQLFAAKWRPPIEKTDDEYPLVLSTVREVGHYSARTMTGNCRALRKLEDEPGYIQLNPKDAEDYGIKDNEFMRISSKRGSIIAKSKITERVNTGVVYMTYQWLIGACNELTAANVDPITQTPEFKYYAVKIEKIQDQKEASEYIKKKYDDLKKKLGANV